MIGTDSQHQAWICDRGGKVKLWPLHDLSKVKWGRGRDAISEGSVELSVDSANDQAANLAKIDPGRHELVLFRRTEPDEDNPDGFSRCWEGPINLPTFTRTKVVIGAKDVLQYWNRTAMHSAWSSAYPNVEYVVARLRRIATAELARKEGMGYNLLPYLNWYIENGDSRTSAVTKPYSMTLWAHLDQLAAKSGIDYTVIGRSVHVWDTSRSPLGQTPTVGIESFLTEPTLKLYGAELATTSIATDGQGRFGTYGGSDPYYGEWEIVSQAYDAETDTVRPTVAELRNQAQRNQSGRNPTPLLIDIPDNSSLDPNGVLQLEHLVPGIWMPLRGEFAGGRKVAQMQKLQTVTVTETEKGETIQVSVYPASGVIDDGGANG